MNISHTKRKNDFINKMIEKEQKPGKRNLGKKK